VPKGEERDYRPSRSKLEMALFIISVPLMIAAVAMAVIPLIVMSHKHHRRTATQTGMPVRMNVATEPRHDEESELPIAA
jgi:flagellar basal body-associated protein FliL